MATLVDAQRLIDELLVARLKAAGCVRGRFAVTGAAAQFSLTGERADGKAMLFREFNGQLFNRLMDDYLKSGYPAGRACLTVDIDVATGHCTHQLTTKAQQATFILDKQAQELRARKNRRSRAPYGTQLAEQVADAVARGLTLAPYHRDYCGKGFDYRNHEFRYGVWDAYYLEEPTLVFPSCGAFVQ